MIKLSLSKLYGIITSTRQSCYNAKVFKVNKLNKPVLVVGNITVGGTGKTPFVNFLIKKIQEKNRKAGVISRGYKGTYKGVAKVDANHKNAACLFGDEPLLLSLNNSSTPIYLSKNRYLAGKNLIQEHPEIDVIVSDDGFQHFSLARDSNIVLIDCTEEISNYSMMPKGRLREDLNGLNRSDLIVFTKQNWISNLQFEKVKKFIAEQFVDKQIRYSIAHYHVNCPEINSNKAVLLSSIAKPVNFYKTIDQNCDFEIADHIIFQDHYRYSQGDIDALRIKLKNCNTLDVVTTEKDWVKIKDLNSYDINFHVSYIEVSITEGEKELNHELDKIFN